MTGYAAGEWLAIAVTAIANAMLVAVGILLATRWPRR